jgi:hypothetical protein
MAAPKDPREMPPRKPLRDEDSTVLAPAPDFSEIPGPPSTGVFDEDDETTGVPLKAQRRMVAPPSSSDVSLIDASLLDDAGAMLDASLDDGNHHAPTEVIRLMRSIEDPEAAEPSEVAPPVLRKWRAGVDDEDGEAELPTGPGQGRHGHSRTRVEAEPVAAAPALPLDVDELRQNLKEVEKLVRQVKNQAAGLDMEAARGMNAQLAAALHRLAEALAALG